MWEAERGSERFAVKLARSGNEHVWRRFTREREALIAIGSPMVPNCFELLGSDEGFPALVMEHIDGPTLAEWLTGHGRLPVADTLALAEAVLLAVGTAHQRGIIHGDLKPANLLLRTTAPPYAISLIDFGLAGSGDLVRGRGTPLYAAPEQLAGQLPTIATDIYAFGVMLFEMATGKRPFDGEKDAVSYGHRLLKPAMPSSIAPTPEALERLILDCLEKDPARRPASVEAVLERVGEIGLDATERFLTTTGGYSPDVFEPKPQPMLFVCIRAAGQVSVMVQRARQHGAFLVEQQKDRYVFCINSEAARPLDAALTLAADFVKDGVRAAVVHAAEAWLHPRDHGPPVVYCEELDIFRWCPEMAPAEVRVNRRIARWLDCDRDGFEGPPELYRLPDRKEEMEKPPLIGRDPDLAWVEKRARAALEHPQLLTITGTDRIGKTHFAGELLRRMPGWLPGCRVQLGFGEGQSALEALREHAANRAVAPLVLIVDDAHRLPASTLELLEYGATGGEGFPVLICLVGDPSVLRLRKTLARDQPGYGTRTLEPLSERAACSLAAILLHPAEYSPMTALQALAQLSQGSPGRLSDICRRIKRLGYVRQRPGGTAFFVMPDLTELADDGLADGALVGASVDLNHLAELCAVLGLRFQLADATAVQSAALRDRPDRAIDPTVGLPELVLRGLLSRKGEEFTFFSQSIQQQLYRRIPDAERMRLHRFAAEHYGKQSHRAEQAPDLEPLARHAAALGDRTLAARTWLMLGDQALAAHRPADAEPLYSSCLECEPEPATRIRALCGRGESTQLLHRVPEALVDLEQALLLAEEIRDPELEARALLSAATAHDWDGNLEAAEACVSRAGSAVSRAGQVALSAQLAVARGRALFRRGNLAEAMEHFVKGRDLAAVSGDYSALIVAMLLLPYAQVQLGDLPAAEKSFAEVLDFSQAHGDTLHRVSALVNRLYYWAARKDAAAAREDLEAAIALARASGNPYGERAAAHNLAEGLFWNGDAEEALHQATRARALQERFSLSMPGIDALLQARICAADGALVRAQEFLAHAPPGDDPLRRSVELAIAGAPNANWQELAEAARRLPENERLEICYLWARVALAKDAAIEPAIAEVEELLAESPGWRSRFDLLLSGAP